MDTCAYVWLSPFAVHLKALQHCLLIDYTPVRNKKLKITETSAQEGFLIWNLCILTYMQTHTLTLMHTPTRPDAEAAGPKSLLRLVPGQCTMEGGSMETAALETTLLSSLLGALGTGLCLRRGVDPQGGIIAHVIWPQSGQRRLQHS